MRKKRTSIKVLFIIFFALVLQSKNFLFLGQNVVFAADSTTTSTSNNSLEVNRAYEAEKASLLGGVVCFNDAAASNGRMVGGINAVGNGISFSDVPQATQLMIRYNCIRDAQLSLYVNNQFTEKIFFPSTGTWYGNYNDKIIQTNIPQGATIKIEYDSGDTPANIDCIILNPSTQIPDGVIEAEKASLFGRAVCYYDAVASSRSMVGNIDAVGSGISFSDVTQATQLMIRYNCIRDAQLSLYVNNQFVKKILFPSTGTWYGNYNNKIIQTNIPQGATVKIEYDSGDTPANIDYIILNDAIEDNSPPNTPSDAYWADPVDTGSGSHKIQTDVLKVKGAQNLSFNLSYDSSRLCYGTMGQGWSNNYEKKLVQQNDGSIFVCWTPSDYNRFINNGSGTYTCNSLGKQNYLLTQNADGSYLLNCNNDVKYSFDSNGQLSNMQNREGMNLNITHDSSGNLIITEPVSGQALTVSYNSDGLVKSVSDSSARTVNFGYSGSGLNTITDPDGKITTYLYDSYGHVTKGTDGDGVVYFTDTYDSQGRIISQDDSVDGNNLTYFSYDTTSVIGQTIVTITDRNGNTRKNVFNNLQQLISVTDENNKTKSYTYDSNGNIASETDELGNATSSVYDNYNHLTEQTDKTGLKTNYTYDANGNMLTQKNPDGSTITYTYDDKNRVTSTTDLRGNTTANTYDLNGMLLTKNVGGSVYTYTYENGLVKTATDPKSGVITYTYDGAGYLKTMTDSTGKIWTYTYDANGNQLSHTDLLSPLIDLDKILTFS